MGINIGGCGKIAVSKPFLRPLWKPKRNAHQLRCSSSASALIRLAHGLDQRNDERIPHGEIAQSFRHPGYPTIREAIEPFAFDGR